jgi:hypothetical protein
MKTKTFGRKLTLNKSTVANLAHGVMEDIKGGTFPTTDKTYDTEETWCTLCQPTVGNTCPSNCNC